MSIESWSFEDFIEFLPVGIIIFGSDLQVVSYNKRAIELTGIDENDLLLNNISEINGMEQFYSFIASFIKYHGNSAQEVIELNQKFLSCSAQQVKKDDTCQSIIIITDATSVNSLEKIRRDYINTILHSLRTPLATLTSSINFMSTITANEISADHAEALSMSISEVNRLNTILDDLKELFYIESGLAHTFIKPKPISLSRVIDNALTTLFNTVSPLTKNRQRIHISGDTELTIIADEKKLSNIFFILLNNAFQYSGANSPVEISISKDTSTATIVIKDYGIGISEENISNIFTKFYRENNPVNKLATGQGLSLFFAKSWIDLMNGSIMCESKEHGGSAFTLTLNVGAGTDA